MDGATALGMLSVAVALLAAAIAWGQWYTAREKLILEIFDKRFSVYEQAREAIGPVIRAGRPSDNDLQVYGTMMREARFLFGDDVYTYLDEIWTALIALGEADALMRSLAEPSDRSLIVMKRTRAFAKVADFPLHIHQLLLPYMKIQSKLPRTLMERFRSANEARHSAGRGQD